MSSSQLIKLLLLIQNGIHCPQQRQGLHICKTWYGGVQGEADQDATQDAALHVRGGRSARGTGG